MVEIMALGPFCAYINKLAESKGHRGGYYRRMALAFWCLGELTGLFAGLAIAPPTEAVSLLVIYACALVGASAGAALSFAITRGLRPDPVLSALSAFPTIGK